MVGTAPSLNEVFPALTTAWRNLFAYPEGHPTRAASLETAHRRLTALLATTGALAFGVSKDGLVYGELRLTSAPVRALGEALHRRAVALVRFEEGLEPRELEAFLRCLGDAHDQTQRAPLQQELAAAGAPRIAVTTVDYAALALTEKAAPERRPDNLWQAILDTLLTGKQLDASGRDPLTGEAYSAEGVATRLFEPAVLADPAALQARAEAVAGVVESQLNQAPLREAAAHQVAELMRALPREVRQRVLDAALKALASDEAAAALLDRVANALEPDAVLAGLRRLSRAGTRLSPHALRLVHALASAAERARAESAPGPGDAQAAADELSTLFRDEDIDRWNPDDHQALLEQAAAVDFSGVAAASPPDPLALGTHAAALDDAALQPRLVATLLELAARGVAPEPLERLQRLFGGALAAGRLDLALPIVRGLRDLEREAEPGGLVQGALSGLLGRLAARTDALTTIAATAAPAGPALDEIKELIGLLGGAAAQGLLRSLAEESSQTRRRRLFNVLVSLGEAIVPEAVRLLDDSRWYVVRNMIALLHAVEDKTSLPQVRRCAEAGDLRVRLEAIKTLLAFDSGVPRELLAKAIRDPDPKLAETAVVLAGQYGIREARDLLVEILRPWDFFGARRSLRLKALRALADLSDPTVLPALRRFFSGRRLLPVALEERRAAFKLLECYPEAARHPYVASGLQSRDLAIRQTCQRLLRLTAQAPPSATHEEAP